MHILYVLPYPRFFSQHSRVGGHIAHFYGVVHAFKQIGHQVLFFGEERDPLITDLDVDVSTLPITGNGSVSRHKWIRRFFRKLRSIIAQTRPDVVYMRYSTSTVLHVRSLQRALSGVPLILEVNSVGSQRIGALRFLDRLMLESATVVIAISEALGTHLRAVAPHVPVEVVPNAIDPGRIPSELLESNVPPTDAINITYAGLLKPDYGLETAIHAADILARAGTNVKFRIIGDGPFLSRLQAFAAERPWIQLIGPVDFRDVPAFLAESHILLYPTSHFNSFQSPTKLFEYMLARRPIVAASTPQTRQVLHDGELGFLYEIDDSAGLAAHIHEVVDSKEMALSKAIAARDEVLAKHTWRDRVMRILQAYSDAPKNRGAGR